MADPIGEIPVIITGDFSKLDEALSQSVIAAELGAGKIADSFTAAAGGADKLDTAMEALRAEIEGAGAELSKWDQSAAAIAQASIVAAGGINQLVQAAAAATQPVMSLGDALSEWGQSAQIKGQVDALNEALKDFANTAGQQVVPAVQEVQQSTFGWTDALKLLGVSLSAAAIKEFAVDALEAFAAVEKATIAIASLTGSAGKAKVAIDDLKTLAVSDALGFPELVRAEQRMIAFGFATDKIPGLLKVVGDTSAAVGINFNQLANVFERVIETGNLQGRQLQQLGLNVRDLAAAMGTTEASASKMFKSLDSEGRIEALESALSKFKGTAGEVAASFSGQWTKLHTEFTLALQDMGEALAPFAGLIIEALRDTAIPAFKEAIQQIKELSDEFVSMGKLAKQGGSALLDMADQVFHLDKTLGDLISGNLQKWLTLPIQAPKILWGELLGVIDSFVNKTTTVLGSFDQQGAAFASYQSALKAATEAGHQYSDGAREIAEKQELLNQKVIQARDHWHELQQMEHEGLVGLDAVAMAYKDLEKAIVSANNGIDSQKLKWKELGLEYKHWEDQLKAGTGSIGNILGIANDLFTNSSRTIIGTFKEQGDAFAAYTEKLAATQGALQGFDSNIDMVIGSSKAAGESLKITKVSVDEVETAANKAGIGFGNLTTAVAATDAEYAKILIQTEGLTSHTEDLIEVISDVNGIVTTTGKGFDIFRGKAISDITDTRDAFGMLKLTADDAMNSIASSTDSATSSIKSFTQQISEANQAFRDFATGAGSFSSQLGILDQTTGKGKKGGAGTTNAQGDFNTGFTLPPHTHLDYSQWGISGARVVPDDGYYFDVFGNAIEMDSHILSRGGTIDTGSTPTVSSAPAAVQAPAPPKLPQDVQKFIDQFAGVSGSSFVSITGGFERVADLLAKVTATGLIPPEAISQLTNSLDTVVTTLEGTNTTLAAMTPVVQTATTQIAAAVAQQAASFARLSDALAPVSAPAPLNTGTPAAFQRISGTNSSSTSVNNIQIQSTPKLQELMNMMSEELQRIGVRF